MRENKRYLLVRGDNLKENIERAILEFTGVLGMSKAGLGWIKCDSKSGTAVISINREAVNNVRASFSIYKEKIIVERVSGTLKGLGASSKQKVL